MAAGRARAPGGGFVLAVAVRDEMRAARLKNVDLCVAVRQCGRVGVEGGVGFERELVPADVLRGERGGLAEVGKRAGDVLSGQGKHEVQIDALKARFFGDGDGADGFVAVVDAAERVQLRRVEALHADGKAVHARRAVVGEFGLFEGAGVGLQGDFAVLWQRALPVDAVEQRGDGCGTKEARRAAADEDAFYRARVEVVREVSEQVPDVTRFVNGAAQRVRVEVAVRAFAHAPGDVDVEALRDGHGSVVCRGVQGRAGQVMRR